MLRYSKDKDQIYFLESELVQETAISYINNLIKSDRIASYYRNKDREYTLFNGYNTERICHHLIDTLIYCISSKIIDKNKSLNPFDTDLDNNLILNNIKKLGSEVISTPIQIKNGNLVINHKLFKNPLIIERKGSIGIKAKFGGILTNNPAINKPIYSIEDLNVKLSYIYIYLLKRVLKDQEFDPKDIKVVTKSFIENHKKYKEVANRLIKKFTKLAIT